MRKKAGRVGLVVLAALVAVMFVVGGLMASSPRAMAGAGDPLPGTVMGIWTVEVYPATYDAAGGTANTSSPKWVSGLDVSKVKNWHAVDVFVTADVSGTATVTVTAQYSADATNWTDAEWLSEGWVLPMSLSSSTTLTNASGVTSTTTSTATTTTAFAGTTATRSSSWIKYQTVQSADGTEFMRVPSTGEYMRFNITSTAAATHGVTVTIKTTLRND